jgi:hypothetical protein
LICACRLFSSTIRPGQDAADQLVFTDDGPVGFDQHHEHIESKPAVGENFAALRQDPETAELEARRRLGYGIHGRRL